MDDLREHIKGEEGGLEHLMRKIPGFSGYKDREQRRQADQIQRGFMADALTRERQRLGDVGGHLVAASNLKHLTAIDRVSNLLDRAVDRIRHASQGYSGFFDAVRIHEADLDRLYEFDLGMVSDINAIGEAISALAGASDEDVEQRLRMVESQVASLDSKLDNRSKTMMGVS